MSDENIEGRREFLLSTGRYALACLLGGGIAALTTRPGEECANEGPCEECALFDTCELLQVCAARKTAVREQR